MTDLFTSPSNGPSSTYSPGRSISMKSSPIVTFRSGFPSVYLIILVVVFTGDFMLLTLLFLPDSVLIYLLDELLMLDSSTIRPVD